MNLETIHLLNEINRRFYEEKAHEHDSTRHGPWPGWLRLLPPLRERTTRPSVLDVGCGNGRFARFLADELGLPFLYVGVDLSRSMLDHARRHLRGLGDVYLLEHDFLEAPLPADLPPRIPERFDLVTSFGVLHHIPSFDRRRALAQSLAPLLTAKGVLALAFWQFANHDRFRKRILPWSGFSRERDLSPDQLDLEVGDHLLSWGSSGAYRYCHFTDAEEAFRLVASLPLALLDCFHADGQTGNLNLYYVLSNDERSRSGKNAST